MTAAITQSPVIGSVTDIGPQSWAAVAADRFYSSYDWLRFCEQDASARLRHIVIRRDGTPSAAVPIHNVDAEPNPCYRWRNILADAGLPAPAGRYLLLGTRRGYQSHLLVDRRGGDRRGDVSALVAAAEELAAAEGMASIAALYVPTPDALDLVHARPGTCPVYLADDAWLELPGSGFDDYLDGLPAARRRKVCYEERRFATHRYRVSRTTLANCVDDATRLVAFTEARYQNAVDTAAIRFSFVRQAAVMGDAAEVLLLHDRQGVVGFCLYYLYGRSLYLRTVGFDYGRLRNAY